ncbi:fas-binding factor 1 homolog isoform X2 [Hypomesus transpacificus]|uniref:fas-binding factor 1 homolog isoform X2 n=1 Tax=Hypomesus transpacificus TaxID=137520 RepID=UPI001F07F23A|nr:fas-binding factor 1 homolog isoform X2 [Hypomesus transpacificus]
MTSRLKKGPISSIDDMLGDLLGDEGYQASSRSPGSSLSARRGKCSLLDDDFFSKLAEEVANDDVDSDVSEADPMALLESMKDMDDMDADLFKPKKKPSSAPAQSSGGARAEPAKPNTTSRGPEEALGVKPGSAPASTERGSASTARGYKKFSFTDLDDPLADLLDDLPLESLEEQRGTRGAAGPEGALLSATNAAARKETAPAKQLSRKREELMFEDDEDDLMFALGFGESPKQSPMKKEVILIPRKESDPQQRARTRLDEILGRGTSPRLLERPPTGERKEQQDRQGKTPSSKDPLLEEDLMFGSYQPTLASTPEGRQSRRQSVRFSTEDVSASSPEKKCKTSATSSTSPPLSYAAADWLGLKVEDSAGGGEEDPTSVPPSTERNTLSAPATEPAIEMSGPYPIIPTPTATSSKPPQAEASHRKEEDDWLAGALNKKKIQVTQPKEQRSWQDDMLGLGESCPPPPAQPGPPSPLASDRELPSRSVPLHSQDQRAPAALTQQKFQLLGLGGAVDLSGLQQQAKKEEEEQELSARIIQLEGQVRALQLERDQTQMQLESVQQRHIQDTELREKAHRARVKLLEESAGQQEALARQEAENLQERLSDLTRLAQLERNQLQEQLQHRLAHAQLDRDREVERLRDLQRTSILEMKKDHEEQVQTLKRLKDEEIDAVTSATSQTRSLAKVMEQMEQFSCRLGELVENSKESTTQGLQQGAQHRDEQLRMLQGLTLTVEEERVRLQQLVSKMDTQLAEQHRQLEKERWRVTAEQAKAEAAQRGLEEERRSLTQHVAMEREELERAKTTLLEQQQGVMQQCAEERRRLAAEWSRFHSQEREQQTRAERQASHALEREANREAAIISMAQEQAELKLRAGELKQREESVTRQKEGLERERAELERQRAELEREKERLSGLALTLKTRAQEVEAFSKLASERHEEGERALQEARRVEQEHQARLHSIHAHLDTLRQQEQHLHQERVRMTHQRREMEMRQGLPGPPQLITTDFSPMLLAPQIASNLDPAAFPSSPEATELQARLALLRHTAQKDRDFLHDEQYFLNTLKNTPYPSAFHTD